MEPRPHALGAQSLSHWTTREIHRFQHTNTGETYAFSTQQEWISVSELVKRENMHLITNEKSKETALSSHFTFYNVLCRKPHGAGIGNFLILLERRLRGEASQVEQ